MDRDRGARSGTSFGSTGKARSWQFTGDTHLSPLSAKNAGHAGLNRTTQAVSSTSTWYAFAGQVIQATDSTSFRRSFRGAGHRPWTSTGLPRNLVSKSPYKGINHFLLSASKYVSPFWLTS